VVAIKINFSRLYYIFLLLQQLLLTQATAENEEPTAGYMFKEIESILFMYLCYNVNVKTLTNAQSHVTSLELDFIFSVNSLCRPSTTVQSGGSGAA
jgi:hypothetical protein